MDTKPADEEDEVDEEDADDDLEPLEEAFSLSPATEIRRGAAVMTVIGGVILALGRSLLWRGKATSEFIALVLFVLSIYTLFGFAQLVFGVSINEVYQNFGQTTAKQKWLYFGTIALTLGLLWPFSSYLFPGIADKIHR